MSDSKTIKNPVSNMVSFEEYFYANLFFWGLLVIVAVISYFTCGAVWDDVTSGTMEFVFVIMGGGFTFVSILDYFYEVKIAAPTKEIPRTR
ncbi:MAG TPA: hypothetical protein VN963_09755 [bacterium]|nr:hypothetical protein [bacterium]